MNLYEEEVAAGQQLRAFRMRETRLRFFLAFYFLLSLVLYEHFFLPEVQWSSDSSLNCFQSEIFLRSRFHSAAIPRPSETWDVEGRFFPYPGSSIRVSSGDSYLTQSLVFTGLLALVKGVFGVWGEGILVAAGSLLLLYTVYRLAERVVPGMEFVVLLVVGFASPVWLGSSLLWGHTLAAGLLTASVLLLPGDSERKRLWPWVAAGVLLAIGTWIRAEGYAFALALIVASIVWRNGEKKENFRNAGFMLAGFMAGILPLWLLNSCVYGRPWAAGPANFGGLRIWLFSRPGAIEGALLRSTDSVFISLLLGLPLVLWIATAGVRRLRENPRWVQVNLALIVLGGALALWKAIGSGGGRMDGLFVVMPYAALAFWYWPGLGPRGREGDRQVRFLFGLTMVYLGALLLVRPGGQAGFEWGARFAMPVFGILTPLAFRAVQGGVLFRSKLSQVLLIALLALGLIAEGGGFYAARRVESDYYEVMQYLKESHAVAIVGHRDASIPQMLTPLHFDKRLYYTGSEKALRRFLESPKPFSNTSIVVLTHQSPMENILPGLVGNSTLIAGDYWAWTPGQ